MAGYGNHPGHPELDCGQLTADCDSCATTYDGYDCRHMPRPLPVETDPDGRSLCHDCRARVWRTPLSWTITEPADPPTRSFFAYRGQLVFRVSRYERGWQWQVELNGRLAAYGVEPQRENAKTAAEKAGWRLHPYGREVNQ
jgi:hypothetical protein